MYFLSVIDWTDWATNREDSRVSITTFSSLAQINDQPDIVTFFLSTLQYSWWCICTFLKVGLQSANKQEEEEEEVEETTFPVLKHKPQVMNI